MRALVLESWRFTLESQFYYCVSYVTLDQLFDLSKSYKSLLFQRVVKIKNKMTYKLLAQCPGAILLWRLSINDWQVRGNTKDQPSWLKSILWCFPSPGDPADPWDHIYAWTISHPFPTMLPFFLVKMITLSINQSHVPKPLSQAMLLGYLI